MKIGILFIGLYWLVLSALPCADSHTSLHNTTASTIAAAHTHKHSDNDGLCTPLCACACCGIQIITPSFTFEIATLSPISKDKKISLPPFSLLSRLRVPVWQPPQH